jgi:hypothetical protein
MLYELKLTGKYLLLKWCFPFISPLHLLCQVSNHITEIFSSMRKPGANIQILQQNLLQKYRYMLWEINFSYRITSYAFLSRQ